MENEATPMSYQELKAKAEELFAKAEEARKRERQDVIKEIKKKIAEYGIRPSDLGFAVRPANKLAPVYRGPDGKTWSGKGRKPRWVMEILARGESLDQYRI